MIDFKKNILELVFPRKTTCNFCRREVFGNTALCEDCKNSLPYNDGFFCFRCGRKTPNPTEACESCSGKEWFVEKARSAFCYDAPISYAIQKFKYENGRYFGEFFAQYLFPLYLKSFPACDCIIPVPVSEERMKERGFNQSLILAEYLSEKTGVPIYDDVVYKKRETEHQVGLSAKERLNNLSGSFAIKHGKEIEGKICLIVDDVLTTGSTANVIAKQLKKHGATDIYLITVASVERKYTAKTSDKNKG